MSKEMAGPDQGSDWDDEDSPLEVQDDGGVDQRVKKRILDARKRVDDREDYLYVQAPVEEGLNASPVEQDLYWGMVVKQYLRTIEPLLSDEEVSEAQKYYREEVIGTVELIPQDTDRYPFSLVATGQMDEQAFKTQYGLPRTAELPQPKKEPFVGLESVLETKGVVSETWSVETTSWSDPGTAGVIQTSAESVVPKQVYEKAVRKADAFLQQAGIGLDIQGEPHGYT